MAGGPVSARTEDWVLRQQGLVKVLSAQGLKSGSCGSKDSQGLRQQGLMTVWRKLDLILQQQGLMTVLRKLDLILQQQGLMTVLRKLDLILQQQGLMTVLRKQGLML
ncbi:hypothetical protein ACLKA6_002983 [Drosophila palustris]